MKSIYHLVIISCFLIGPQVFSQKQIIKTDTVASPADKRGDQVVYKCTPWHHLKCVYITGTEVYKDGSAGKSTRHWWRMSYIGRACTTSHGTTFGKIFEGFFAVPHYFGVAIGNGIGYLVYIVRGSPQKIEKRKARRKLRRTQKFSIINTQHSTLNTHYSLFTHHYFD